MSRLARPRRRAIAEPTWEIARLFPQQGDWSEEEYLALDGNHLIEFSNGILEVLPMPATAHQRLVAFLYGLLHAFAASRDLGEVLFASLPVQLWRGKFREPDIMFMLKRHASRIRDQFWKGADLVMEVVSDDAASRNRDLRKKRVEYAKARIPEYWVVDPREEKILVMRLAGTRYVLHGEFSKGTIATSHLLSGLSVDVTAALASQGTRRRRRKSRRSK